MRGQRPAVAVLLAIAATYGAYQLGRAFFHPKQGLDLAPAYLAAKLVVSEGRHDFYDDPVLTALGERSGVHGPHGPGDPVLNFVYPPWVPLVYAPLSVLPWQAARRVFFLLSLAAIAFALKQLTDLLTPRDDPEPARLSTAFVAAALYFPIAYELMVGQANGLLLLALTSCLTLLRKDRPFASGLVLAVAGLWKPFLLAPALFLVARRESRALAGLALGALSLVGLGFLVGGGSAWADWWTQVSLHNALTFAEWRNHGIQSAALALLAPGPVTAPLVLAPTLVRPLQIVLEVLALGLCVAAIRPHAERRETRYALQMLSTLVLAVLVTPKAWEHYGIYLLPAFLAAYALSPRHWAGALLGASFAVWAFVFQLKEEYAAVSGPPLVAFLPAKTYAAFGLLVVCAALASDALSRAGRDDTSS